MPFSSELPVWAKVGTKPPATMLNTNGWVPGDKPPADWLNWFFNLSYEAIKELQLESLNVDQKGVVNGIATLGADGKVPASQLNVQAPGDATELSKGVVQVGGNLTVSAGLIDVPTGTTNVKGVVFLEDSVTSSSIIKAATPKSVKTAYDLASEAKTQANDQKTKWASVIGSPLLAADTSTVLQSKSQTIKNTLASNLTNKGQSSVGTESLTSLVNKVPFINTGKKFAEGTGTSNGSGVLSVAGLNFIPTRILVSYMAGTVTSYQMSYDLSNRPIDSGNRYLDGYAKSITSNQIGASIVPVASDLAVSVWNTNSSGFTVIISHANTSNVSWFALE